MAGPHRVPTSTLYSSNEGKPAPSPYIPAGYCEIGPTDAYCLAPWTNKNRRCAHATTAPPLVPINTVPTLPIAQRRHFINMAVPIASDTDGTDPIQVLLPWGTPRSRHHFLGEHLDSGSASLGNTSIQAVLPWGTPFECRSHYTDKVWIASKFSYELPDVSVQAATKSSTRVSIR